MHVPHFPAQRKPISCVTAHIQCSSPPKASSQLCLSDKVYESCLVLQLHHWNITDCCLLRQPPLGRLLLPTCTQLSCSPAGMARMWVSPLHQVKKCWYSPAVPHQRFQSAASLPTSASRFWSPDGKQPEAHIPLLIPTSSPPDTGPFLGNTPSKCWLHNTDSVGDKEMRLQEPPVCLRSDFFHCGFIPMLKDTDCKNLQAYQGV